MAEIPTIKLAPDVITDIGPFAITNAHMGTFLVSIIIILAALYIRKGAGVKPTKAQVAFEMLMDFIMQKMVIAFGDKKTAKKFFPLIFTIFLFLLVANQFAYLPLVESIVTEDGIKLFRTPASHYSLPIAYTIFIVFLSHILALFIHPIRHIGNFIKIDQLWKIRKLSDIPMAFLNIFLGLLDIIGEVAKLASLSTRLFGNVFAGGVIIIIISGISTYTQFLAPIPFLILGTLAGFVQAFVFAMLSILYISSALNAVRKPQSI
ncbi:F0F1 ATP synthase subunit A [Candidatus Gracilibacteria bacterium]|nr:F0F1 ATP synthase subunit A [Candidatus Gracilibacteria bacterium]